jgi:hypothetical protein
MNYRQRKKNADDARIVPVFFAFRDSLSEKIDLFKAKKSRCRRIICDFSFWFRLPDSERRPTDYKGGLGPCGCVAQRSKSFLFFPWDVGFPCGLRFFSFQSVPAIRGQLVRK